MPPTPAVSCKLKTAAQFASAPIPHVSARNGFIAMGLLIGMGMSVARMPVVMEYDFAYPARALWALLVVQPALFMGMSVTHWRQRALWMGGAVMALVVLAMAGWVVWRSSIDDVGEDVALVRLAIAASLWWFIALAWFQGFLEQGHWRVPYARLYVLAWNNALVMALTAVCVGLLCGVRDLFFSLCAQLGMQAALHFLRNDWLMSGYVGVLLGMSLYLVRRQEHLIQMARQTLHVLGCLLLPLMALGIMAFVLLLAVTGLAPLWKTGFASAWLMGGLVVQILLVNTVYQDGSGRPAFYGRAVLNLVHVSMVGMLVPAGLACLAIGLRVQQYGWTGARVWAAVAASVLLLYSMGYAWAAVLNWPRRSVYETPPTGSGDGAWLAPVSVVNRGMSWMVLVLLLALMTPVLDADRISANDQVERLRSGQLEITRDRVESLRFDHGPYGWAAVREFGEAPVAQDPAIQYWLTPIYEKW